MVIGSFKIISIPKLLIKYSSTKMEYFMSLLEDLTLI